MGNKHFTFAGWCLAVLLVWTLTNIPQTVGQEPEKATASLKQEDGLKSVEFDVLTGTVEVDLPDDMSETDTITGSVIAEPKGDSKEEIAQNEDTLNGFVVEIEKTQEVQEPEQKPECKPQEPEKSKPASTPSKPQAKHEAKPIKEEPAKVCQEPPSVYTVPHRRNACTFKVPPKCGSVKVVIKHPNGGIICEQSVRCNPKPPISPAKCSIPPSGTCGKSLCIPGPFDGRTGTAHVAVNGKSCAPVAISPRKYIASMPTSSPGKCSIAVTNHGQVTRSMINLAPAKPVAPKHSQTSASKPEPKPAPKPAVEQKYYFQRTGPFIEHDKNAPNAQSVQILQDRESQLITFTYKGPSVNDRNGQTSTSTFVTYPPPERLQIGDQFQISGNLTGTTIYSALVSVTCGSPWLKTVNGPTTFGLTGPFIQSGAQIYQVTDAKKMTDDYYKQHPEAVGKYPPLPNEFQIDLLATGPRGYRQSYFRWKYVLVNE